jgi:hypothetical protein
MALAVWLVRFLFVLRLSMGSAVVQMVIHGNPEFLTS